MATWSRAPSGGAKCSQEDYRDDSVGRAGAEMKRGGWLVGSQAVAMTIGYVVAEGQAREESGEEKGERQQSAASSW